MLKLILTGNLGQDAVIKTINPDNVVIEFSVAHTEKTKDQQGNYVDKTNWVKCSKWAKPDKTAVAQYLKKGSKVCVIGVPSISQWTNQQGEFKTSFEVRVDEIELMGSAVAQPNVAQSIANVNNGVAQSPTPSFAQNINQSNSDENDLPF